MATEIGGLFRICVPIVCRLAGPRRLTAAFVAKQSARLPYYANKNTVPAMSSAITYSTTKPGIMVDP
jgi:hypothetical protein